MYMATKDHCNCIIIIIIVVAIIVVVDDDDDGVINVLLLLSGFVHCCLSHVNPQVRFSEAAVVVISLVYTIQL